MRKGRASVENCALCHSFYQMFVRSPKNIVSLNLSSRRASYSVPEFSRTCLITPTANIRHAIQMATLRKLPAKLPREVSRVLLSPDDRTPEIMEPTTNEPINAIPKITASVSKMTQKNKAVSPCISMPTNSLLMAFSFSETLSPSEPLRW